MSHYFENDEEFISHLREIKFELNGHQYSFISDNGVFSKNALDRGTEILLETLLPLNLGKKILDLGCGYGPIGLVLAYVKKSHVTMCDINNRALALAQENAKRMGIHEQVAILQSDVYQNIEGKFDSIVSNPPIRAGKKVLTNIYVGAKEHLIDGGSLFVVIRKAQGADSTLNFLQKHYSFVQVLRKKKGYVIIQATMIENDKKGAMHE